MSAKDAFHEIVKTALQKDGWQITHDPYNLQAGTLELYIDLGAEKVVAAQKDGQKIAIEIKSFLGPSKISQFYTALGQFISYRAALQQQEADRILYLAVPSNVYDSFFTMGFIQSLIKQNQIHLIVYDIEQETIAQWQM
ncbi:MAG: XisH family protein [Tychonema bourrellyi B0820]|uniref:Fatty-acid oxidation protein subunit alpha n=1 Tax=Tychonema bourrellyi FEM_GT703 TaxID=2040638 RepID=A0A2G4F1Q9_9CYAN|nr:XisH family protein [Tychonema bourrellyi]MDQ2098337.1 XisH family protein [Tychonema bourrellyi B0820]PHX55693.1 fatty-acid oxidation protein subunit alpha [Tychonema bourrellyi FEM_GT703]